MMMLFLFPIDKKNYVKKNIVFFSTMHSSVCGRKDERRKPHVHNTFHDHAKEGVDVVDLIYSHQSSYFKSL